VLAKLSELLFVEAVRRYAEALPDGQTGWLAGLRDSYVARALALMHHDITRRCFTRLIGVPPMHYLANWRMQVATEKLRNISASSRRSPRLSDMTPRPHSPARSRRRLVLRRPPGDVRTVHNRI
jgi:methylphosphotriester-DNA--protein-cysteine methyltransferase